MATAAASVGDIKVAIDEALKGTGYSCKVVSWDDVQRGEVQGQLSCWGSNITDTRLNAKDGTSLFTVRSDNWNEKLGVIDAKHFALLVGNCEERGKLRNVTLHDFLCAPFENGAKYSGMNSDTVLTTPADTKVSIRFQTVFLPVTTDSSAGRGSMQFATEAYNYSAHSDEDPRNLVLLATTQGLSVQADGKGSKRLFLHKRNESGKIGEYWLEAESTRHKVGGEQKETMEERAEAIARGKATSETIGIKAMGQRFNVLATIQIPLEQKKRDIPTFGFEGLSYCLASAPISAAAVSVLEADMSAPAPSTLSTDVPCRSRTRKRNNAPTFGVASAARVSRGDYQGPYAGLSVSEPKRNAAEHVTITSVLYNTVIGGVPSPEDCTAAIEDLSKLYAACSGTGNLTDAEFDFMRKELTVGDMLDIEKKTTTQAPVPPVTSPKPTDPASLVRAKIAEVQAAPFVEKDDVLMLKLLTLGALRDDDAKTILLTAFDKLKGALGTCNARYEFTKIKVLIEGALTSDNL